MAAKRVDPLKAKAAKQKKIAIGGGVLLLALVGFQGPKTLKLLKGPQVSATVAGVAAPASTGGAAPAPEAAPAAAPATGGAVAGEVPAPAAATELASVADSDAEPVVSEGQLATFERFASKDPFAQQAKAAAPAQPVAPADGAGPGAKKASPAEKNGTDPKGVDGGFTTGGSAPAPTPAREVAAATSIAVNGVAENVQPEAAFPAAVPTFVLVSVATDGKSVEIGIAGGEYASGGETLKLSLGKKITLQNTADGSRYELQLLTIQGFPLPKLPKG